MVKGFSLDKEYLILKVFRVFKNITLEGTISLIFYIGPSFHFIQKNAEPLLHFSNYFSKGHKTNTRTYRQDQGHFFVYPYHNSMSVKFV